MITESNNTYLGIKSRIKAKVILKSKNAVIRLHSIVTEYLNKAFRFKKACTQLDWVNESTCDILYPNWYKTNYSVLFLKKGFLFICLVICELVIPCPSYGQVSLTLEEKNNQKKQLTPEDYELWESIFLRRISNNGVWVSYTMNYATGKDTLFIKNTKSDIVYKIPNGLYDGTFSNNDNFFAYGLKDENKGFEYINGVGYINLKTGKQIQIQGAIKHTFSANSEFLAIYKDDNEVLDKTKQNSLLIIDLVKGTTHEIKNVSEYGFNESGNQLVYISKKEGGYSVSLMNLKKANNPPKIIASNAKNSYHRLIWDENRKSFAFMEAFNDETFKEENNMVHHYHKKKLYSFDPRVNKEFPKQMYVSGARFSKFIIYEDSQNVFFCIAPSFLEKEGDKALEHKKSDVQVWSWKDKEIYPKLKIIKEDPGSLLSVWSPTSNTFMQIINQEEKVLMCDSKNVLTCRPLQYRPIFKYVEDFIDIYITDLITGKKELFLEKQLNNSNHTLYAPNGDYISYFKNKHWWVYDIKKKTHTNITKKLPHPTYKLKSTTARSPKPYGKPGWTEKGNAILIHDQFDIWLISLDGTRQERLTNGRNLKKRYRIYENQYTNRSEKTPLFKGNSFDLNEGLLFSIYGERTKKSGYASWNIKKGVHDIMYVDKHTGRLLKAKNNNTYIVSEERFDMPPKLVLYSENKKKDIVQSNLQHDNYSWGRSELIEYSGINGDTLRGALFYPANYQVGKKYPMIVGIYEIMSQRLHNYVNPSFEIEFGFNPTNFTLNDYFVLYPDITYEYNNPGISATKCVVSAVKQVLNMGLVDKNKIGLWGHSFGGYETTFTLTQTDMFAAAVAGGSASSDILSAYLSIYNFNASETEFYENAQMRFTGSFWQYEDAYIRNSPIHNLNKINTPLLSWHGEKDVRVDVKQGVELYSAMRRLEKEHIFLVYPNGGHTLKNTIDQIDITKKIMHWFDFKLKGEKPMPWLAFKK